MKPLIMAPPKASSLFNQVLKRLVPRQRFLVWLLSRSYCVQDLKIKKETKPNTQQILNKILYNDILFKNISNIKSNLKNLSNEKMPEVLPKAYCLQYVLEKSETSEDDSESSIIQENNEHEISDYFHLPYAVTKNLVVDAQIDEDIRQSVPEDVANLVPEDKIKARPPIEWETYKGGTIPRERADDADAILFGTCDPKKPISNIPCGGCGALLHCIDEKMPGFLPKELFSTKPKKKLKSMLCRRCFFLQEFNIGLGVNVSAEEYPKLLSQIKNKNVLVILMIDLLDYPCSIWPDISNIIGSNPVIIVANKVDLLIREFPNYEEQMKRSITDILLKREVDIENIIDILITSAKSGNSVERIIHCINYKWNLKGDVYLVGSTNVGKSTLFNTLIQSDICSEKVENAMKRATVSAWPGTTLNLLKFPMRRIKSDLLKERIKRLNERNRERELNFKTNKSVLPNNEFDYIQRTKKLNITEQFHEEKWNSNFQDYVGIDASDPKFRDNKWCHDTPGVIQKDQITNLLTTSELLLTLPKSAILPRNFILTPGDSLFVGGLVRLDITEGALKTWITVYASMELPITVTRTEHAEEVYRGLLGSNLFRVPCGGPNRLSKWPDLASKSFEVYGRPKSEACGDIVLSSAGWVSVYLYPAQFAKITAWTPEGRGIHLRDIPLIKTGHLYRGQRIKGTPAYKVSVVKPRKIGGFYW